jgi:hypothetical protein
MLRRDELETDEGLSLVDVLQDLGRLELTALGVVKPDAMPTGQGEG